MAIILIKYLPPDNKVWQSILIFYIFKAMLHKSSVDQEEFYKKDHLQITQEVRNGLAIQSYHSDIDAYSRK